MEAANVPLMDLMDRCAQQRTQGGISSDWNTLQQQRLLQVSDAAHDGHA
jgi:hypothetical protein